MNARFLCIAAVLGGLAAAAPAQSLTEHLLFISPDGFKVGYQHGSTAEWVPDAESVEDWSQMVTVQIYEVAPTVTSADFLGGIERNWMGACPETPPQPLYTGTTNGYPVSMLLLSCPRNAKTGKPETTAFRVIQGRERLYSVQRAFRSVPSKEALAAAMRYLGSVSLCDSAREGHPCPAAAGAPPAKP